jgi:protoporphyrinogen oxidase
MHVAVIGAGPAGLSAAYMLAKSELPSVVFEASGFVGGLARSFELWGQMVDVGPHRFFSKDRRVNQLWLEVIGQEYRMVERRTRILYNDRFFQYPLRLHDTLSRIGVFGACACVLSYLKTHLCMQPCGGEDTLETWLTRRFGRRLFHMFFKSYSEKLWGRPCSELDADFAAQRIKGLSLFETVKNSLGFKERHPRTLAERFAYPIGGTGIVYQNMAQQIGARGGAVFLKRPVKRVVQDRSRVVGVECVDGEYYRSDHVISTMPLTLLIRGLEGVPAAIRDAADMLRFRNTIVVYLNINQKELFEDQWIYVHSPALRMGRVTNFNNWIHDKGDGRNTTILALEYWCDGTDIIWGQEDDALIRLATQEIRTSGLIGRALVLAGHVVRVPFCYPVYARGYKRHLNMLREYLDTVRGLTVIGRYGAFKYNNQDHSILMGILAAENVGCGTKHNLWGINADYDEYQESALISETGLVPV